MSASVKKRSVLPQRVIGIVKWFNVKRGYGFIRSDTLDDVLCHRTAITRNNQRKVRRSVGRGGTVQFDVVVGEGHVAANVTGPNGEAVQGSPYAADRHRFRGRWFPKRRRPMERNGALPQEMDAMAVIPPQRHV